MAAGRAAELVGDLPGGLRRAGDLLEGRIKLREQLVSALSYPLFVLVSTIAAALMILLLVVPTLAPLVDDAGGERPLILGSLITVSDLLRAQMPVFLGLIGAMIAGLTAAGRAGLLAGPVDRFLHEGPPRKVMSALTFGGFAIALGGMLASGAPMTDALRLAIRGVNSEVSRRKLEPVATAVRQGHSLSVALQGVRGFPGAITRMAAVGEATGALGAMLARAGRLEEASGLKRIDAVARLLGPALIVVLGGLVGLLMAGLLSGVTELGQAALR
jgi:type II secretory pathway component PulF